MIVVGWRGETRMAKSGPSPGQTVQTFYAGSHALAHPQIDEALVRLFGASFTRQNTVAGSARRPTNPHAPPQRHDNSPTKIRIRRVRWPYCPTLDRRLGSASHRATLRVCSDAGSDSGLWASGWARTAVAYQVYIKGVDVGGTKSWPDASIRKPLFPILSLTRAARHPLSWRTPRKPGTPAARCRSIIHWRRMSRRMTGPPSLRIFYSPATSFPRVRADQHAGTQCATRFTQLLSDWRRLAAD